jgi:hypothetical protein
MLFGDKFDGIWSTGIPTVLTLYKISDGDPGHTKIAFFVVREMIPYIKQHLFSEIEDVITVINSVSQEYKLKRKLNKKIACPFIRWRVNK